jgi:delta14-sterol reductase
MTIPFSAINSRSKPHIDGLDPCSNSFAGAGKASEFFGPVGTAFLVPAIPLTIYALYFACNETSGGCPPSLWSFPFFINRAVTNYAWWAKLWDPQAFLVFVAWMVYIVVAWAILPGDWVEGTLLRNGARQTYKINGEGYSDL